jgi:1-acyl-sn-glycerol-3-phosphate acyltransferase
MNPDTQALLVLTVLAVAAGLWLWRDIRATESLSVWTISRLFRTFVMLRFGQRMHGPAPLDRVGGALIVANHRSPVDPLFLYAASLRKRDGEWLRPMEFLTAAEYCAFGGAIGWVTRTARSIPVRRDGKDMQSAKEALRRLQAGRLIAIFPEGGIHIGPGLGEFNSGVAWLALRGGVPVIPAFIRNAPRSHSLVTCFLMSQPADVVYGKPLDLSPWLQRKLTSDVLSEVTSHLRQSVAALETSRPMGPALADSVRRQAKRTEAVGHFIPHDTSTSNTADPPFTPVSIAN